MSLIIDLVGHGAAGVRTGPWWESSHENWTNSDHTLMLGELFVNDRTCAHKRSDLTPLSLVISLTAALTVSTIEIRWLRFEMGTHGWLGATRPRQLDSAQGPVDESGLVYASPKTL